MTYFNPSDYSNRQKIKNEYRFTDAKQMSSFVSKLSHNPGVMGVDMKTRDVIEVTCRSEQIMDGINNLFNESYQPLEENELARQAKMRKFRQQQDEPRQAKQREIARMRDAESRRRGEEAKKKEKERLRKKQAAERERLDDSVESELKEKKKKKGKHDCATHVEHAEFGEGRTVNTMHAAPDENGDIAWYDVMFEHGIEKGVASEDLNILISEVHEDHDHHHEGEEIDEMKDEKDFKPHMMYDPKTGKGFKAEKYEDHLEMKKKGFVHDKPKEVKEYGKARTANAPLVKTGQGDYEKTIRPSDVLKKMKKKKKR